MKDDLGLAKKIFVCQLEALTASYVNWITLEAHRTAVPTVATMYFTVEKVGPWHARFVITLKYFGRDIRVTFENNGHDDCENLDIDFADVTSIREQMTIVSEFTYELYSQLLKYAIRNNFVDPSNVI